MQILTTGQYNQGIAKNKLLSSTAGVGAVITTRIGYYILISDMNKWEFVQKAQKKLTEIRDDEMDDSKRYDKARKRIPNEGIEFIDDKRFIEFLREEKGLQNLICLIGIPNISLNEQFNTPNWKNHPIRKLLGEDSRAEDFMVKGTHFPKWFISKNNDLRLYKDWKRLWVDNRLPVDQFAPPKDANSPILDSNGKVRTITIRNERQGEVTYKLYEQLTQTNLILICRNGHLSDIPWPKFLRARTMNADMKDLFSMEDCCARPNLKWTESKTKSEGYGSIYIHCENCGTGKDAKNKINLEGINSTAPFCPGHKPWEIDLGQNNSEIPYERCCKGTEKKERGQMQVALVTGNNVYYANGFSSLFIPQDLVQEKGQEINDALTYCNEKYKKRLQRNPDLTKKVFWDTLSKEDIFLDNNLNVKNENEFIDILAHEFLKNDVAEKIIDRHEDYRWKENKCFVENPNICDKDGLIFCDIELPIELTAYFSKIQQVEELKVTQVQLDFNRVKLNERVRIGEEIITSATGQNIFSSEADEIYTLPANEIFGEGLFFQFNDQTILAWIENNKEALEARYKRFFTQPNLSAQGASIRQRIFNNKYKHFLIHTFSHIIMRELEFSCGYPTASLKERLYISNRMSGLLIYTAEGSEGSMGGLVWQGQPEKIKDLIIRGLSRAFDCSSDPLCWESEGQGLFELNLAACFSCNLVSETACEEMNLGLDRRSLIDSEFGFFNSLFNLKT
jgi:hypothetical protein